MLRIVNLETTEDAATLRLEGRVIGPWVDVLRRSCERIRGAGARLTLDCGDVAFVERDGARLLKALIDGGVAVVNCPAFVSEQLKALSAGATKPPVRSDLPARPVRRTRSASPGV